MSRDPFTSHFPGLGPEPRFYLRLLLLGAAVPIVSTLLTLVFAPRALLLGSPDALRVGTWVAVAAFIALGQTALTLLLARRFAPTLRTLFGAEGEVRPRDLVRIDALPAQLVAGLMAISTVAALVTTHPAFRAPVHDVTTQATLALFYVALVAAVTLPLYVTMRASVARVLELAPTQVTAEALELESPARVLTRVRTRFLLAVAGPVAFIALGASLLAYAHVSAAAEESERMLAEAVAVGTLDRVSGSAVGREQAISAAASFGILASVDPHAPTEDAVPAAGHSAPLVYPVEDGVATIRLPLRAVGARTIAYVLVVVLAAVAAGLLGARLGAMYSQDLELARSSLDNTGAQDVVIGLHTRGMARFGSVARLLESIEELGQRFREFAAAHERATSAKETTESMRALFLAAMSHDLKVPLNSILGFASLVARTRLTTEQQQSLSIIEQRGRELLHLIEIILDAARAEAGQLEIAVEETAIGDVIMSAVLDARDLAQGSEVAIVAEVQPAMPSLYVDSQRMVQALVGVIGTAARFTEKGRVSVRATHGQWILIDIETAGRGLHPGEREKIFEAFKYPERARRLGSLGLELSLARAVVELHRGAIDVDVPQDGGITFHVRLPVTPDAPPLSVPRPSVRAPKVY